MIEKDSLVQEVENYLTGKWEAVPNHPWRRYPEYTTFKAGDTDKWFALLMRIRRSSLNLAGDGDIWVINLKAEPGFLLLASGIRGIFPAYHMNKEHWITILLDGSVSMETICQRIDRSYELITDSPTKRIYAAVKKIPRGKVATYAQVAAMAGNPKMCRAVGNALHKNPDGEATPCYRVVNSKGELAEAFVFGGKDIQAQRLREDGIEVVNGKVDLKKYGIQENEYE